MVNQSNLSLAQEAGGVGTFDLNITTQDVVYSDEGLRLIGLEKDSDVKTQQDFEKLIYPEDKSLVTTAVKQAITDGDEYDVEYRIQLPNGELRWIRDKGKVITEKDGSLHLIGVNYDITKRKKVEQHLRFKADGSKLLSSSLTVQKAAQIASELTIKYLADWCVIDMLDEFGQIQMIHVAHKDPNQIALAKKFRQKYPVDLNSDEGLAVVLRTGEPVFVPKISEEMINQIPDPEKLRMIKKIGIRAGLIIPINIQGKVAGAISMVLSESNRNYDYDDLEMANQLASRISLCLENAVLYQQVKTERERLIKLVANVPCVVWEVMGKPGSQDQKLTFINSYAKELLGYPLRRWKTVPHFWVDIIHPDDLPKVIANSRKAYEQLRSTVNQFRWMTGNGKEIWVETHTTPICNQKGEAIGMRGVTTDISKRVELEQRKDDFIAMASHELKTPLTSLKLFAQVLQTEETITSSPKLQKYVSTMEYQVDRLHSLVIDLLDISKIQAGKLKLEKAQFSFEELVREVIHTTTAVTGHEIVYKNTQNTLITADKQRMTQVIVNLLENAAKYSPQSTQIILSTQRKKSAITLKIQDFGIGIPEEHHTNLFQRFYRVFDKKDQTFPGLGMGLFIAKNIIEKHKGRIWFTSTEGKGSSFYIELPLPISQKEGDEKSSDH